jgi:hypothetical protein
MKSAHHGLPVGLKSHRFALSALTDRAAFHCEPQDTRANCCRVSRTLSRCNKVDKLCDCSQGSRAKCCGGIGCRGTGRTDSVFPPCFAEGFMVRIGRLSVVTSFLIESGKLGRER